MDEEKNCAGAKSLKKKYTESVFYEIFLTGKYIKKLAEQLFKEHNLELTNEEFSMLDFLYQNNNICQRDIAVKLLINRANVGKILNKLEKSGYIKRIITTKLNHPAKIVSLTDFGTEMYIDTVTKLRQASKKPMEEITEEEAQKMIFDLEKIRGVLKKCIELDI